ncbi:MAG TPA: MnmC family methyltransferase [Oculatellaceae cyanobacterium]
MTFSFVTTADGTLSCLDIETGELMHNRVGAYTEALHHYAKPSNACSLTEKTGQVRLLDACYGLGYNTWALVNHLLQTTKKPFVLSVTAIEKNANLLQFLPRILEHPTFDALKRKIPLLEHNIYYRTLSCPPDTKGPLKLTYDVVDGSRIELTIFIDDLRERVPQLSGPFDLVFHDAFSPQRMPELWTVDLFREYQRLLPPTQGKLLTYSTAAAVRGGLLEAGFKIGKTPALGDKQGGTIAGFVEVGMLLTDLEQQYLESKAGIPYRDPDFKSLRAEIIHQRQKEQSESLRPSGSKLRKRLGSSS